MIIVGEKINSSIPSVGKAIAAKDETFLTQLSRDQAEAGAHYLDVNAGVGDGGDSGPDTMKWLVNLVQDVTETPLCIDSDDPAMIIAGLDAYRGNKAMINSLNAEADKLDAVGPIAAERKAGVVALVMKEGGIPRTVEERLAAADIIMTHLSRQGVAEEQVYFDPLVLPISVETTQAMVTLETISALKRSYPAAKTIMGLSNVSFGLPNRGIVNRTFFVMAASYGLDAAIVNPLDAKLMSLVTVSDMLTGNDPRCKAFVKAHRKGLLTN